MAAKENHYEILHSGVGPFTQGQVVSAEQLGKNVDVKRLLQLEAIQDVAAPAEPAETEAE